MIKAALLPDRGVVKVVGDDARKFLNGLLTAELGDVAPGRPRFAALLTPQGKIVADFIVAEAEVADGGGFLFDCPRALVPTLVERLNFYKLRAKVMIEDLSDILAVMAIWNGDGTAAINTKAGLCVPDPRLDALGARCLLPSQRVKEAAADFGAQSADARDYDAHRIILGVPQGGVDFAYGDAFPHEADMDQLDGVDFDKGCFVGQEVVSRIEHRGIARNRLVPVTFDGQAPQAGAPINAAGKAVGIMGSATDGCGLAMLRLDRVSDALADGTAIEAGGTALHLAKPDWARFAWPGEAAAR